MIVTITPGFIVSTFMCGMGVGVMLTLVSLYYWFRGRK